MIAFVAITQLFAVPMHAVLCHGHGPDVTHHADGGMHVHADEHAHTHCDSEAPNPNGDTEAHDASDFGDTHHHGVHAHNLSDPGFWRARGGDSPVAAVVVASAAESLPHIVASGPLPLSGAPPPRSPQFQHPSLRGPPVG